MNRLKPLRLSACVLASALAIAATRVPAAETAAPTPVMATHHATYKLTLLNAKGPNAPNSAKGFIDYTFSDSGCDVYMTDFRQLTEMQPGEGDSKLNDMRSTTSENLAATQFTFKTKTTTDDETVSDVEGRAERDKAGAMTVDIKHPVGKASFGAEVLFPTEHLRRIIVAAEKGEKLLSADVYDGSDGGQKLYHTLTVIGAPLTDPVDDAAGQNDATKGMRRWPVVISYFQGTNEDQPDYVLSSDIYENGISRALQLDYGDFTLAGRLVDLTVTPPKVCTK